MAAETNAWEGGEVLIAGGTDWAMLGRSGGGKSGKSKDPQAEVERQEIYPNLLTPHRLKAITGVRIMFIAAGASAAHLLMGGADGALYTLGRNDKGQLGHGDTLQRNAPARVTALKDAFVTGGAAGKHHSVVVTRDGESYAFGLNAQGQCGTGSVKKASKAGAEDLLLAPAKASVSDVASVAAGQDFTLWLTRGGAVWAAGNPQHGQLGGGNDHMYNAKDSSIKIMYEPQPTPARVLGLEGKTITRVAAGVTHSLAVDDAGAAYSWGCGDYGKLGHRVQQDELAARQVEAFKGRVLVPADAVIAVGGTSTFSTATGGQLYGWGKMKTSGDNATYPTPVYDLQGWNVRSMACGPSTFAIAADRSVITWGAASNGELGYGEGGKKSSANPDKCMPLDDVHTQQVAAGVGFTAFLVKVDEAKVVAAPVFEPKVDVEPAAAPAEEAAAGGGAGGKRKAPAAGAKGGKAGKKAK